jgi:RHS repeat-associated protein
VWVADYAAFGEAFVDEDPDGDLVDVALNIRFPGQYFDAETGLHYNRFRYYDPETGRYVSADPIGQWDHGNIYQYAYNSPAVYYDPLGLNNFGGPIFQRTNPNAPLYRPPLPPSAPEQAVGAVGDFVGNYVDMRSANTIGADKYFHCKASCDASQRGQTGEDTAEAVGDAREAFDAKVKGDSAAQCEADKAANQEGREAGAQSRDPDGGPPSQSCSEACAQHRPSGLPRQY